MAERDRPGLGELLRYVGELVDQGAEETYRALDLNYRPRFTPVLRALEAGAQTVSEVTARSRVTQGAVSQTVGLMVADGLIERHELQDGRKSGLRLTPEGQTILAQVAPRWEATFAAITALELEIGHPLLRVLEEAAAALERQSFALRLQAAHAGRWEASHV